MTSLGLLYQLTAVNSYYVTEITFDRISYIISEKKVDKMHILNQLQRTKLISLNDLNLL